MGMKSFKVSTLFLLTIPACGRKLTISLALGEKCFHGSETIIETFLFLIPKVNNPTFLKGKEWITRGPEIRAIELIMHLVTH
ncbi:hypothetical protein CR513_44496, partial [Mucuna pruriens]